MSELAVDVASKLYGARKAAKFMLGDRYREFTVGMAENIREIISASPRKDLTPLLVAKELAGAPGIGGHQALMVLATAVDMTEGVV
jgi:hypothetical protein